MPHLVFTLTTFVFFISCGESATKKIEPELKKTELSLKETELNKKDSEKITTIEPKATDTKPLADSSPVRKFILIKKGKKVPGSINSNDISKLSEPLLAIAAFYSGLGGSNCNGKICELTSALGLGKQGSQKHKNIISKWLPNNTAAKQLLAQDCYQPPNGASSFSNYEYFALDKRGDTIYVNYNLIYWNRGSSQIIKGPDQYLISGDSLKTLRRNIWKGQ